MKKTIRSGGFFAKAEGAPSWRDRLAKMKLGGKRKATAKLEIADESGSGETLIFPELGDISEIAEGVDITATDGTHVFTADGTTYTIEVAGGKVLTVVETPADGGEDSTDMSAETVEFIEAVAEAIEEHAEFKATALKTIGEQAALIATMQEDFKKFKATMGHKVDKADDSADKKELKIGGKSIDLAKLNLK